MTAVAFTVYGVPAPQGSKVRTQYGVREDNPRTLPWRQQMAGVAAAKMAGRQLLAGPLEVVCEFVFPRPKAHYGSGRNSGEVKDSAPRYHAVKPDADKLARAVGDSLSGIVYRDDSQVSIWKIVKVYGVEPRADVIVREVFEPYAVETQVAA